MRAPLDIAPRARPRSVLVGLGLAALCYGVSALGAATMRGRGRPRGAWFALLRKGKAQPPARVFAPVWLVLYGTIAFSAWRVWRARASPERTRALRWWAAQLGLNAAWTPLFFGLRRPVTALADIGLLDAAAGSYAAAAAKVDRVAAIAVLPYLGWLGFATYLNGAIVVKNRRALIAG
jgi:tryptophan-rich sensory protein